MPILPYGSKTLRAKTQTAGDSSTLIATDAFVTTAVNNAIAGVNPAIAVSAATTSASNTSGFTYNNGVSGVGATLTQNSAAIYTVDGFTFSATTQRLLVKNDTQSPSGAFNGIYLCTTVGTALIPAVFTRAVDYDTPSDINNTGAIPVINGTVNGSTSWVETANIVTVGTTPLAFTQFTLSPTTLMTTTTYDPAAIAQQVVGTTATQTLANKTLTTPTIANHTNVVMQVGGNPVWQYLGYTQVTSPITTTSTSVVYATGLTCTVSIPTGATAVKITAFTYALENGAANNAFMSIWSGASVGTLTTQLQGVEASIWTASAFVPIHCQAIVKSPSSGSITYNVGFYGLSNTTTINAAATYPAYILVECC
jgi:hypothetical protein